jgi:hypothetical protein
MMTFIRALLLLSVVVALHAVDVSQKDLLGNWRVDPEALWKKVSAEPGFRELKPAQLNESKAKVYAQAQQIQLLVTDDLLTLNESSVRYVVKSIEGKSIHIEMKDPDDETKSTMLDATIDGDQLTLGGPGGSTVYKRVPAIVAGDLIGEWSFDVEATWNANPAAVALVAGGAGEADLKKIKDAMFEKAAESGLSFTKDSVEFMGPSSKLTATYDVTPVDASTLRIELTPTDGSKGYPPFDVSITGNLLTLMASDGATIYRRKPR